MKKNATGLIRRINRGTVKWNALIVDTGTSYWPCGTYNYKGMTRRDSKNSPVSYRP